MKIEILGTGCKNCKKLYDNVLIALQESGKQAEVEKVEDLQRIMAYGVMKTPGLVIDGVVKVSGRVASSQEVEQLLK